MRNARTTTGRVACLALALLGLAGCGGASSATVDPLQLRGLLNAELVVLSTGIQRGDALLASEPIDDEFRMDDNVATRYQDAVWGGPDIKGPAPFLAFLTKVFSLHANITLAMTMSDVQQNGDLATATVHVVWNSTRTDSVPPGHYTADNIDYFFFRRRPDGWRLLRWQEQPAPAPPLQ